MIDSISWGTYLFFACMNACFIPIIYFFYPETKKRSLEEIDLIFAKGFTEKIGYVQASQQLPYLSPREVEQMSKEYGFIGEDEEKRGSGSLDEKVDDTKEKKNSQEGTSREREGTLMARTESDASVTDTAAQPTESRSD